jgi:protein tyrosine phosphatase (PTP) superfamily phosphohydrolase (DUF442 family)
MIPPPPNDQTALQAPPATSLRQAAGRNAFSIVVCLAAMVGCGAPSPSPSLPVANQVPRKLDAKHLPNAYQIHGKVISGGQPDGEEAFQELAELGVQTIISVDGATPDVALAQKYGLRYVHLPHGYDGIPAARIKELAKAVRDLPGPIYIHCHHGKHRSPAAAAVACVAAGLLNPAGAETVLRTAGTSESYRGLYLSAREARPLEKELLDALPVDFPATAKVPPLAESMVAIEHAHDRLKEIAAAGWKSPPQHPDLEPAHEALLLREHFTELLRTDQIQQQPEKFRALLRDAETSAKELEEALGASQADQAAAALERINRNCTGCHREFRDTPLQEK